MTTAVLAIAAKDLRQLVRDRAGMFWALAFPLVVSVLFGTIFSEEGDGARPIHVVVVDEDQSPASARMVERLADSPSLRIERMTSDRALESVRKGDVAAYLRFGPGYGASGKLLPIDPGAVEIGMDPSRRATAAVLQGLLMEAIYEEMKESFAGFGFDPPRVASVVRSLAGRPRTSYEITFPQSTGWALIAIISFFATVIARERETGNLMRLRLAPISLVHILAGKGLAALIASFVIMTVVLVVGIAGFGLRIEGYPQLVMAMVCSSFSAAGLILLFSNLGKTAQAVEGACWTVMIPLVMAGGGMLPLVYMPDWLQTVSNFSPLKWNLFAIEGAVWRGLSLGEMLVPCGILIAIGLAAFGFGGLILSRSRM